MKCLHCASSANEGWTRGNELSLKEKLALCGDLHELGCENVALSGGEALLDKDWEPVAKRLVGLGINVSVISNGLVIDAEIAKRIKDAGLCRIALSLDGLEATHNYIRGNSKSFKKVIDTVPLLARVGLPVNFVTHINSLNIKELRAIENLAGSLGINVWRLQLGSPIGRMAKNPNLLITPDRLPEVADFIVAAKKRQKVTISVGDNIGYFSHHEQKLRSTPKRGNLNFWCGCSAGCLNLGIESNGNVKGCLSLQSERFVEGNVRTEPLRDIWNKKGNFSYTRDFKVKNLKGHCRGCEYGEICRGGCVFMAYGSTGTPHNNPYCLYNVMVRNKSAH